ncbi:MAG: alpha/beta fold hydrolase [Cytophagia bacterium]|nr:alpha/beta fold hydrolase [Cytophagia bacterium]
MHKLLLAALLFIPLGIFSQTYGNIAIKDGNIYYQTFGGGRDTLLIINGGPGMNSEGFAGLATELGKDAFCLIYDQRGTGKSHIAEINNNTITMDLMVEDIESLRKSLGISEWIVFGQSFGGMLGSYYATKHPENIKGLILSASGGIDLEAFDDLDVLNKLSNEQRQQFNYWSRQISNGDTSFNAQLQRGKNLAPAYLYFDREADVNAIGHRITQGNMTVNEIVHRNMRNINFDCKPELRKFKKPVLILQGTEDIIPVEIAQRTHDIIPNSELVLMDECAHYGWLEAREIYFEAIQSFFKKVDTP